MTMSDAEKPPFPPESNESGAADAADTVDAAAAVPTDGSERAEEVPPAEAEEALPPEPRPAAEARTGAAAAPPKGTRPDLADRREIVELTKDITAMMAKGGDILIGTDDAGEIAGSMDETLARRFDEADLRNKLERFIEDAF